MAQVNVTDLRNHLPAYLRRVREGEEVVITSRGKIIAKLVPALDPKREARRQLSELRNRCRIGDVVSPIGEMWDAEDDRP
jgi:prevent-host-death family protein